MFFRVKPIPISSIWDYLPLWKWIPYILPPIPLKHCLPFFTRGKPFGTYVFQVLFEYILTDKRSEFGDPKSLETGFTGIQRTSIYYCDPMRSEQQGGLEQAHTMLWMILPKETNFEFLTQWDVNLIVSHINSPLEKVFMVEHLTM